MGHTAALVWAWWLQIWPNLAASVIGAVWVDVRAGARHLEAQYGHRPPVTSRLRGVIPRGPG